MVTIEIEGVKVEADTLKAAQKLARKEQARQNAAEREREKKSDLARLHCYAQIGHWAEHLDLNGSLPPAHCPITRGTEYGDGFFRRQVTNGGNGDTLRIESEAHIANADAVQHCWGYRVVALVENGGGWLIGAKLQAIGNALDAYYVATHAIDDVTAIVQVPKFIGEALDKKMQEREAKRKQEVAA